MPNDKDYENLEKSLDLLDEDGEVKEKKDVQDDDEDEFDINSDDHQREEELLWDKKGNILDINLNNEMENSFLSYAMSVIVQRALPDVRDGMKPVHRRILYAMSEIGVYSDKAHKKSARIVGDVIGKYHPHGDTAVYEAMVRMAQDFSYRYPLVDGHGNFGSIDGDGAAAMRYTEARMSRVTNEMLRDINKNTVDFQDNYDGTEKEPVVLPARIPNLLVNGASGIAVGMATNIPTHNLTEVINGVLALIEDPNISIEGLMEYIPAPDFPTGGIIMGMKAIKEAYNTGMGTIIIRAKVKISTLSNGKKELLITEIPYQVNKTRLIERIAEIAKDKIIEGITDLRDESNHKGIKVVIELRKDANVNVILNNLYKHTQLQTTFGVNMIALDKGQPKLLNLKQILECYLEHQIDVVTRRTIFDLEKAKNRLHIVEGLLIALANIDEVVHTIKTSKTTEDAVTNLIKKFLLSERQAKAILDMKLQSLTGLQIEKLEEEKNDLNALVEYLNEILDNHDKKMKIIIDELKEIQRKYGDDRRSELDFSEDSLDVQDEDLIPVEDVIITVTNRGYIKRLTVDTYRAQKRGGKGITGTKMQEDDFIERVLFASSHDTLLFFSNFGKVYSLRAFQVPQASRAAKGLPIVNLLKFEEKEKLAAIINVKSIEEDGGYVIFGTKKGNIKKTELIQYKNIRSTGIRALILNQGDELIGVAKTDGTKEVIFGASNGKAVCFNETQVRPTNRAASGVKGIQVENGEQAVGLVVVSAADDEITVITSNGFGKRTKADTFKVKGRNGKGVKYMNITPKSGKPVAIALSTENDDLMVITDKGMIIRTHMTDISIIGRDTQGVKIIKLNEGHSVSSIAVVPRAEDEEEEQIDPNELTLKAKLYEFENKVEKEIHHETVEDDNDDENNESEE